MRTQVVPRSYVDLNFIRFLLIACDGVKHLSVSSQFFFAFSFLSLTELWH